MVSRALVSRVPAGPLFQIDLLVVLEGAVRNFFLTKNDNMSYNVVMKLINRKELERFKNKHAQSAKPLIIWENIVSQSVYKSFPDLRRTFPSADYVPQYTVFNISGNKYRLITEIDYEFQLIDIRAVWTHAEYSQKINIEKLNRGKL